MKKITLKTSSKDNPYCSYSFYPVIG